jgi:hypothetical protein
MALSIAESTYQAKRNGIMIMTNYIDNYCIMTAMFTIMVCMRLVLIMLVTIILKIIMMIKYVI